MPPILALLRPKQWTKNLLVLAPYLFTAGWQREGTWLPILCAFVSLSLISSANYILNDLLDVERDKLHPKKSQRPLAKGLVGRQAAIAAAVVLALVGLGFAAPFGFPGQATALSFGLLQLLYTLKAKHVPILDISALSMGYVLRPMMGAATLHVPVSGWLVFCTGSLAMLLAAAKRRQEFMALGSNSATRPALQGYSQSILDSLVNIGASVAVLSYGIYAIESPTAASHPGLLWTVPLVAYGVLRYLYLVLGQNQGEEPESTIFHDRHMLVTLGAYVVVAALAMGGVL